MAEKFNPFGTSIKDFYQKDKFERDKIRFRSTAAQQRSPAGYQRFLTQQTARNAAANAVAPPPPAPAPPPPPPEAPPPPKDPPVVESNIPPYDPKFDTPPQTPFDTSGIDSQIGDLNSRIASFASGLAGQYGDLQEKFEAERQATLKRMQEMTNQFQQAMSQRGERPKVEGIRFADRGTGGATQQQLQRRGLRGTFGRSGERLMKISSLNV